MAPRGVQILLALEVAASRATPRFAWMQFGLIANLVLFGSIFLVLMLERRSAARLRELYADAAATTIAVGPVCTENSNPDVMVMKPAEDRL